ncbi:MAG: NUDIX hydrolase [Nocardioides sp.]
MHFSEFHTRLAAYALILDDQGRVLLTWWNGEGRFDPAWTLPGGGIDFDEALRDGLVREVREETGYDIEVGEMLADHFFTRSPNKIFDGWFRSQRFVYAAEIVGGELGTLEVGGSTDFARWVSLDELLTGGEPRTEIVDVALAARR